MKHTPSISQSSRLRTGAAGLASRLLFGGNGARFDARGWGRLRHIATGVTDILRELHQNALIRNLFCIQENSRIFENNPKYKTQRMI
jgi:hypothetical protein